MLMDIYNIVLINFYGIYLIFWIKVNFVLSVFRFFSFLGLKISFFKIFK